MDSGGEENARRKAQRRALQVHPHGALIRTEYQSRTNKVVPVNESDLRDLLSLDAVELGLMVVGQFMLAGGGWLFVEKYLDADRFQWSALTAFCAAAMLFGGCLVVAGLALRLMKRRRIRRIFDETETLKA